MIGKLVSVFAGERIARQIGGVSGPAGAVIGAVAPTVLRRLGPVGIVAAVGGGYVLKKLYDKQQVQNSGAPRSPFIGK